MHDDVWKWGLFAVGICLWIWYAIIEIRESERKDHKIFCILFGLLPPFAFLFAVGMYFWNRFF